MTRRRNSRYFLSLPHDSAEEPTMQDMDPAELHEMMAAVAAFNTAVQEVGAFVSAEGMHPPSSATTVDYSGQAHPRTGPVRRS